MTEWKVENKLHIVDLPCVEDLREVLHKNITSIENINLLLYLIQKSDEKCLNLGFKHPPTCWDDIVFGSYIEFQYFLRALKEGEA